MTRDDRLARYAIPDLPTAEELSLLLKRIDAAKWYSNFGALVAELEAGLCELIGRYDPARGAAELALTTLTNGQTSIEMGLGVLLEGRARGRVLLPSLTFAACAHAVRSVGHVPVFSDVDPATWTLTPEVARATLTQTRVDVVMPVSTYGFPQPVDGWDDFVRDTGVAVLIDGGAALGNQRVPGEALVAFSLHCTKPFGIGEGGLLVARRGELIERVRQQSNFGFRDGVAQLAGRNAKLSEYHAAVGVAQLSRWASIVERRKHLFDAYFAALAPVADRVHWQAAIDREVHTELVLAMSQPCAEEVRAELRRRGVGAHAMYLPPLHEHPVFADAERVGLDGGRDLAVTRDISRRLIGLPFHTSLRAEDVNHVVRTFSALLEPKRSPRPA